jgi:homocitrate synthase NifV
MKKGKIKIIDTTLRDGLQSPDVVIKKNGKIKIAELLAEAGVDEIEAGIPARGRKEIDFIRAVAGICSSTVVTPWCRPSIKDIAAARKCDTGSVHVSFPFSSLHLRALGVSRAEIFRNCSELLKIAVKDFAQVSAGIQDATRTPIAYIVEFISIAMECGVHRIRIADTVGTANPLGVKDLVGWLIRTFPEVKIDFHAHNDLGMATANSIVAAQSGAGFLSVTVNGLGERAGNAALEEVVMAIESAPGIECGIKTESLYRLCMKVSELSGRPITSNKPVTGSKIFTHQSGIHCFGLSRDLKTFEPFSPESVGRKDRTIVFGPMSGHSTVGLMLDQLKMDSDPSSRAKLFEKASKETQRLGRILTVEDIEYLSGVCSDSRNRNLRVMRKAV